VRNNPPVQSHWNIDRLRGENTRKEIELKPEDFGREYAGKYVFETLSYGTSNKISSDCTSIEPTTRKTNIDLRELNARMLDAVLVERPNSITLETLRSKDGIPAALGEFLSEIADLVNGYSPEDRERLKKLKQRFGLA
jgi:hypothetical protein